jgi:ketosteroid isomerase-like protein
MPELLAQKPGVDRLGVASHSGLTRRADTPEALHAIVEDGFNRRDVEAVIAAYDDDATLVVPPYGDIAHGRDAIRVATAVVLARQPEMTLEVNRKVESDNMAMTHGRWRLALTLPDGTRKWLIEQRVRGDPPDETVEKVCWK